MVKSILNPEINYPENKELNTEDVGHHASIYVIHLFDTDIAIVLGKQKFNFINKNVVYYPIYIVSDDKIKSQIGVYEVNKERSLQIIDEDGDVDIEKIGNPLLYSFVTKKYIQKAHSNPNQYIDKEVERAIQEKTVAVEKEKEKKVEEKEITDEDDVLSLRVSKNAVSEEKQKLDKVLEDGIFAVDENFVQPSLLPEETEPDADKLKLAYKDSSRNSWIEKFMKNNEYSIVENEGSGDCFFAVLRDAFDHVGKKTTVQNLRSLLASELTDEVYQEHRKLYNDFESQLHDIAKEMKDLRKTNTEYANRMKKIEDKQDREKIIEDVKRIKARYDEKREEQNQIKQLQQYYVGFMKDIKNIDEYREYIQTSKFWADAWAISTLEHLLKIKVIIMSEEAYKNKAFDNVLNCGEINKDQNVNKDFAPNYYVIASYDGQHYRLITYKRKHILTFREIPYDIKILIVNKCLEKNAGSYYLIQDFRNFKSRLGIDADEGNPQTAEEELEDDVNDHYYNKKTVFVVHSKSLDSAKPGQGSNETIEKHRRGEFAILTKIKDWRRKLDDSWNEAFFNVDGHRWASVEHYVQGSKFKKGFPDFYRNFSMDEPSELSKDVELAKMVGDTSKTKYKNMRPDKVKVDVDYALGREDVEREAAVRAKFNQNEDLKQLLLATRDAQLKYALRRKPAVSDMILMKVRHELQTK